MALCLFVLRKIFIFIHIKINNLKFYLFRLIYKVLIQRVNTIKINAIVAIKNEKLIFLMNNIRSF